MLSKELTVTLIRPLAPGEEITLFGHSAWLRVGESAKMNGDPLLYAVHGAECINLLALS